ncbi:MAG: NAD(P)-dependent oxidoreductase, partial [Acidimicrobiaceae bacterium]|nr:NAD(P)-dependent oxidoreductase [Acidimicrobiaceae bacterium]
MNVLITGARGQLGTDLQAVFAAAGHHRVLAAGRGVIDVADREQVLGVSGSFGPDLIVHAAAWTAVDACESDPDRAWAVNALGSRHVAEAARLSGAHLLAVSTDYVFDGTSPRPYTEWDRTNPMSAYGRSKMAGEIEVLEGAPGSAVVRTAWVCGVHGSNMVKTVLRLSAGRDWLSFVDD